MGSLISDGERLLFCIRQGRFVEAVGFAISDECRMAKMDDLSERASSKDPRLVLSLTWVASPADAGRPAR